MNTFKTLTLALAAMTLAGCAATKPSERIVAVPVPVPCPAAENIPDAPPETLDLDASKPGVVVQQYAANRAQWIGHGKSLRKLLESCK